MPDEIADTQPDEVQDADTPDDESSAFDEAVSKIESADDSKLAPDEEGPAEDKEQKGETETLEQEDEDEKEPEPEKDTAAPSKKKTARDIAEERAKKFIDESDTDHQLPEEPPEQPVQSKQLQQQEPAPSAKPPSRLTKEQVADLLRLVPEDELPDGEIIIGDQTVNLRDYKENYPDEYTAMQVLAGAMAQKMLKGLEKEYEAKSASTDELRQAYEESRKEIEDLRFWQIVGMTHADGVKVARSDGFSSWLKGQSNGIKALAGSPDPSDGIAVLDLYKEEQAKSKIKDYDDKARAKKKANDDLHKGTLRSGTMPKEASRAEVDENDEHSGWELYFKQKEKGIV